IGDLVMTVSMRRAAFFPYQQEKNRFTPAQSFLSALAEPGQVFDEKSIAKKVSGPPLSCGRPGGPRLRSAGRHPALSHVTLLDVRGDARGPGRGPWTGRAGPASLAGETRGD